MSKSHFKVKLRPGLVQQSNERMNQFAGLFAETVKYGAEPAATQYPKPWPWFLYQTVSRAFEIAMGYAMASITKQPSISPRHQYLSGYPNYSPRVKRGNNPYI